MKYLKIILNLLSFVIIAVIIVRFTISNQSAAPVSTSPVSTAVSSSSSSTVTQPTSYTLADVAKHNNQNDCWMVIGGNVYDMTSYINQHPGGMSIVQGCGVDATDMFNQVRKHDPRGVELLPNYLIGSLK